MTTEDHSAREKPNVLLGTKNLAQGTSFLNINISYPLPNYYPFSLVHGVHCYWHCCGYIVSHFVITELRSSFHLLSRL